MHLTSALAILAAVCSTLISSSRAASSSSTNHTLNTRYSGALCPISDDGKFKCVTSTQFVICLGARTVVQNMAAGVPCVDGLAHPSPAAQSPTPQPSPAVSSPTQQPASSPSPNKSPVAPPAGPNDSTASHSGFTPLATLKPSPSSVPLPATSTASDPNLDPVHHGTKSGQTIECAKKVKQIGLTTLDGFLYCVNSTHYTVCRNKSPTDVYIVPQGTMCQQLLDRTYIVAGRKGNPG